VIEEQFLKRANLIESKLKEVINDDEVYAEYQKYSVEGGKRLRPVLCLLCCESLTDNNEALEKAIRAGISIEITHNASLVQDSIIDRDEQRRGKPSLYTKVGDTKAILTSDLLLSKAVNQASLVGLDMVKVIAEAWQKLSEGAIEEIETMEPISLQWYYKVIEKKTATLFAASAKAGALSAGASEIIQNLYYNYGRNIGIAFQLADDLVDILKAKKQGKYIAKPGDQLIPLFKVDEAIKEFIIHGPLKAMETLGGLKDLTPESFRRREIDKHIEMAKKSLMDIKSLVNVRQEPFEILYVAPEYFVKKMLSEIEPS